MTAEQATGLAPHPYIPELPEGASVVEAAQSYAAAGWFVAPVDPETKNPGSRLGKGWQLQTSRDPSVITAWWQRWPEASLALHVGRSGAVVLDVDEPTLMPPVLVDIVTGYGPQIPDQRPPAPFQSTRDTDPARGHYVFGAEPGAWGNSLAGFREAGLAGWGEVRGLNAVIVVQPSVHTKRGGRYQWITTGALPEVPEALAALLRPPGASAGPADPTEVREFLSGLPGPELCPVVQGAVEQATAELEAMTPGGRHDYMLAAVQKVVRLGEQGHHGAGAALDLVQTAFYGAKPEAGGSEYHDAVLGAVRNALANQTLPAEAGCCPSWLQDRWMQAAGFTPPPIAQPATDGVVVMGPWLEPQAQVRNGPGKFTDAALAETLAAEALVGRYRWAAGLKWLKWDGRRWKRTADTEVTEQARLWALGHVSASAYLAQQSLDGQLDDTEIKNWTAVAKSSGRMASLVKLACGVPGVLTDAAAFDHDPDILNVANGVLHLPTGQLHPHDPRNLVTKLADVDYVPGARHPDWDTALQALPPDERQWLQLRFGQAVTGYMTPDDLLVVIRGGGENGKSTLFDALYQVLGDYHVQVADRALTAGPDAHPTELMDLRGARVATIEETPEARQLNVVRLKKLVGSAHITARYIAQDSVTYDATHSLFVASNYRLLVTETDHGTWRRLALLEMPYRFRKPHEPLENANDRHGDPDLKFRLGSSRAAHSAVLSWLADGAWAWYAAGRRMPPLPTKVADAVEDWRKDSDMIHAYWSTQLEPCKGSAVLVEDLRNDFNQWAESRGQKPWGASTFRLRFTDHQTTSNHAVYEMRLKRWNGDPAISRPLSALQNYSLSIPKEPSVWRNVKFVEDGTTTSDLRFSPSGHTGHTLPDSSIENSSRENGQKSVPTVPQHAEPPPDHSGEVGISVTQGENPQVTPQPVDKPKTEKQKLSIEAKAEAKRIRIMGLAGPDVNLPAVVMRDGTVAELSLADADTLLAGLSPLSVDVETSGYPLGHNLHELRLVQLGNEDFAVVLDPKVPSHRHLIRDRLTDAPVLHAHNATADITPLAHAGLVDFDSAWERMDDTVLQAKLNDPASTGADPGLKEIAEHVLGDESASLPADVARAELFSAMGCLVKPKITDLPTKNGWYQVNPRSRTFVRYAGSDVLDTSLVAQRVPQLPQWLADRERTAAHMVSRVALVGVPIDADKVGSLLIEHTQARAAITGEIQDRYGIVNPGSAQQVATSLTEAGVRLPRTKPSARFPNGQPSVAEGVLESLKAQHPADTAEGALIDSVLTYRHHNTALGLFLEPYNVMVTHGDGRARTTIYTLGADTGRMSSVRFNFQQLPKVGGFRSIISTDPGMSQIGADFSSVEIRVAAEVSGDQVLLRMLDEGLDPHAMAAALVFGPDWTQANRYQVKSGVFGRIYGGGLDTLATQMGVPHHIAQKLIDAIDTLWPTLSAWSANIKRAVERGTLTTWTTYSGRIIHLPRNKAHAAPNYIIQGTARELLIDAMVRWRATRWGTAVMWPVHDEVDVHVPTEEAKDATVELVRCMETTMPSGVRIIAKPSEPSEYWRDAA